mgnify:FL=1
MSDTFDLTAFIDNTSYPRKKVTVYTNVAALKEVQDLETSLQGIDPNTREPYKLDQTPDQLLATQQRIEELRPAVEASGLTFELQGMPFRMAQEIADIFNEEEPATEEAILTLVRTCIQSVENAEGAKSSIPTKEVLEKLQTRLSPAEFSKLINATVEVNFTSASYEADIDAGFPVGSADVE